MLLRILKQIQHDKTGKLDHMKAQGICHELTIGTKDYHPFEYVELHFGLCCRVSPLSPIFGDFCNRNCAIRREISIYTPDTRKPLYHLKALLLRNPNLWPICSKPITAFKKLRFFKKNTKKSTPGLSKSPGVEKSR